MLPRLALVLPLAGCSLLYKSGDLPNIDAPNAEDDAAPDASMIDAETVADADSTMLVLTSVKPAQLLEGQGVDGSRPAVLLITGKNFVKDMTTVTLSGATGSPMFTVDNTKLEIDISGNLLAVPVTLPVDETASDTVALDVTVTQNTPTGLLMKTLPAAVSLRRLPELKNGDPLLTTGFPGGTVHLFSRVQLTAGTIRGAAGATEPVVIRSTSSISASNGVTINFDAAMRTGGAAGGTGGLGGLLTPGANGTGPDPGTPARLEGKTVPGDPQLKTFSAPNRSSGGGGGGTTGGDGGGGGGSIDLIADGDLAIHAVNARGAAGGSGALSAGGPGSGGFVLVRAGGTLNVGGAISVAGATSGGATSDPGRVRYDAGSTATGGTLATAYRGAQFSMAPLITTTARPSIGATGDGFKPFHYYFFNDTDATDRLDQAFVSGARTFTPTQDLYLGLNRVCLLVDGAAKGSNTENCIDVVYLRSML